MPQTDAPARGLSAGVSEGSASRWAIFGVASLALFMSAVDSTIVATGLRTIGNALHSPINWTAWTITGYQLGLVITMPVAGRVADQVGRKKVFVAAGALFTTASLLCGLTSNIAILIGLRILQAIGGGAFLPAASGVVADSFGEDRDKGLGLFSSVFPFGALVGPIFGGIILADWSWRGIFLVNVPVGIIFTLLAARVLPSTPPSGGRTDLPGAALLGGTVLCTMLVITRLGDKVMSPLSFSFALPFLGAWLLGALFVRRCASNPSPLIPIHLLRERAFAAMNWINFVWGSCAIGFGALVPLFAEDQFHLSPLSSGTLLTARSLGEMILAALASMLIRRTGYHLPMLIGFLLMSGGLAMMYVKPEVVDAYTWLATAAALTGIGVGTSAPASNNATIELSPEDVGTISGLRGATRQVGGIIGVAIATAVVARSADHGMALGRSFLVLAVLLCMMIPLILLVPRGGAVTESPTT